MAVQVLKEFVQNNPCLCSLAHHDMPHSATEQLKPCTVPTHWLMQGSQKACPQRSTNGFLAAAPLPDADLPIRLPPLLLLLPAAPAAAAAALLLLLAPASPLLSNGADGAAASASASSMLLPIGAAALMPELVPAGAGSSKSSRQMGQLVAAYCRERMAAWSRLMELSLSAQRCSC
jgi:hypothetical protein